MTASRDELIEQARQISTRGRNAPFPGPKDTAIAKAFVDAYWRPGPLDVRAEITPPTGDVIEQAAAVLLEEFWCNDCDPADGACKYCSASAMVYAQKLAHYGLLATPPLRDVCDCHETPHERGSRLCEQAIHTERSVVWRRRIGLGSSTWGEVGEATKDAYRDYARAALRAITEADNDD